MGQAQALASRAQASTAKRVKVSLETLGRAGDYGALAHYADPAYYAKAYASRRHDVEYYVRLAQASGGPVLEYGVGEGRVALPLIQAGLSVVGVDLSRPMLDRFEQRLGGELPETRRRIRLVHGDMRTVRLSRRFPLVLAPFNAILHLYTRSELEQFLARVRAHLAPGGRFVFDFCVPDPSMLGRDPERRYGAPRLRHPTTGQLVRYAERFDYDPMRQLLVVWMEFSPVDGDVPWVVPLTHRQYFPEEMASLLEYNGFGDQTWVGDFGKDAPTPRTDWVVVSARLSARSRRRAAPRTGARGERGR